VALALTPAKKPLVWVTARRHRPLAAGVQGNRSPDPLSGRPAQRHGPTARCRAMPQSAVHRLARQPAEGVQQRRHRGLRVLVITADSARLPTERRVLACGHHPIITTSGAARRCPDIERSPGLLIIALLASGGSPSSCSKAVTRATARWTLQAVPVQTCVVCAGPVPWKRNRDKRGAVPKTWLRRPQVAGRHGASRSSLR